MRTLLIDTASPSLFVGVIEDQVLTFYRHVERPRIVSDLHPSIVELLSLCGLQLNTIDRFAVVRGPGNWTGVNAGIVAAKMFAIALEVPLVMISRMRALFDCRPVGWENAQAIIAAGRTNYFLAGLTDSSETEATQIDPPSERLSVEEVRQRRPELSVGNLVVLDEDDLSPINFLFSANSNVHKVRYDQMITAFVLQVVDGRAEVLRGESVHLALPDYAGADRTIQTSAGSFR